MLSRSAWLHLRIPFSFFLLPVYLLTVGISPNLNVDRLLWSFIIIHIFLYPASNGFNSYFDKDKESIGGLKNPPPVNQGLYYLSLLFDLIAIGLAFWKISFAFALMLFIYGLASKAYSHPAVRIKKYPIGGWLFTGFFQGFFTVWMCHVGINNFGWLDSLSIKTIVVGLLASLMLMGNYPMTQIYQHNEDASRGDYTLSLKLGILGTFYFTALWFGVAVAGFAWFFNTYYEAKYIIVFLMAMLPVVLYFGWWFLQVYRNRAKADYIHTMWLNMISATSLNIFFIYFFLDSSNVLSAL